MSLALASCSNSPGVADDSAPSSSLVRYGDDPSEFGSWQVPAGDDVSHVVVLVHGGFFRVRNGDLNLMSDVERDLVDLGFAVWNIEYGRVGEGAGGWPHTYEHVGGALDHVERLVDPYTSGDSDVHVAIIGHSAGGHLGAWASGRGSLTASDVGGSAAVVPELAIGLGAIHDIAAAAADGVGEGAVVDLLGGMPSERPDRYRVASVAGPCVVAIHGSEDETVPIELASQLPAGPVHQLVEIDGVGHFDGLDPDSATWRAVRDLLDQWRSGTACLNEVPSK